MNLELIKGIGDKTIEYLNKLHIYTIEDLITYYPYRYNVYKPSILVDDIDSVICVNAIIETIPKIVYVRKNFTIITFKALTDNKLINTVIYNRNYLYKNLSQGKEVCLIGKYEKNKNKFTCNDIKLETILETKVEPVYHTINGLKISNIRKLINKSLYYLNKIDSYVPKFIESKYNFINISDAIKEIHSPSSIESLKKAKIRLIYEEFFVFMLKIEYLKKRNKEIMGINKEFKRSQIDSFINELSFKLTNDQLKAINECLDDLQSRKRMNRLLEGDVGSGKTIVAEIVMYANYLSGFQSALMAPTEVLAEQHYKGMKELFKEYNLNIELLTGSSKDKKRIKEELKNGNIDIIVGTHSLISEDVLFKNLGLVITDEQHRFGVNQRTTIQNKGEYCDILYMSATPIPRTYAMVIYQDMDTSLIKEKPKGRKEIITKVLKKSEIKIALQSILECIKKGNQVYVVAPSIEEDERDTYNVNNLLDSFNKAFNNKIPIEVIHGKMNSKEKNKVMQNFKEGRTKILISTTVIEVGIDVSNATMIVIFNAEMFGLATLHQLRGRVGRNDMDSYCYLISDSDTERLRVMEDSNDGFYISEQDFLMRKGGDLFGTKQSGDMIFKIADLRKDFKILKQAKMDSEEFLNNNKNLEDKYIILFDSILIN